MVYFHCLESLLLQLGKNQTTDNFACFVTMFYVFKRKSHPYSLHLKFLPKLPPTAMSKYLTLKAHKEMNEGLTRTKKFIDYIDAFGGIINGKLIIGYYNTQNEFNCIGLKISRWNHLDLWEDLSKGAKYIKSFVD